MSFYTQCLVLPSLYRDSVVLMQLSQTLNAFPDVDQAAVMMGTPRNRDLLREADLLTSDGEGASPNDLLICVRAKSEIATERALQQAKTLCLNRQAQRDEQGEAAPRTLSTACRRMPTANLACISVPGEYAGREARRALERGLHVFLFSDHVDLETEIELKQLASQRGLLVMGPDCGTAIVQGKPLGFANQIPRGPVGLIAASGTGLQQVSCLLANHGVGISQALGVGGRDLHQELGGLSMRAALQALAQDVSTEVIVLISKPPAPEVAAILAEEAKSVGKRCVLAFVGAQPSVPEGPDVVQVGSLEAAALTAVAWVRGDPAAVSIPALSAQLRAELDVARQKLHPTQRLIRGLYCGGTLASEAFSLLGQWLGEIDSNLDGSLTATSRSRHTVVDLGAEEFTLGRPHPMIDPAIRRQYLLDIASQPETAVVLCDVMLGWGSHEQPGVELATAWQEVQDHLQESKRQVIGIATICGTPDDPQDYDQQVEALRAQGFILAESNAQAVRLAAIIAGASADEFSLVHPPAEFSAQTAQEQAQASAPVAPSHLPSLFEDGPRVLNLGLESFAAQLQACDVPVLHIDWQPPASGNARLANLLDRLQ